VKAEAAKQYVGEERPRYLMSDPRRSVSGIRTAAMRQTDPGDWPLVANLADIRLFY